MKIALVSPYGLDHPGGVQDQVARLSGWLNEQGHDAWVVAPGLGEGWHSTGDTVLLPVNRSRAPIALGAAAVRRAIAAVAPADVVHVHEPLVPMVSLGVVLRSKRPLVGTFHADPSRMVRRMYRWGRAPLQRVVSRIQVATAVSDVAAEAILPFAEPRLIPNAVDASAFPTTERHDGRVVFVGRDEPRKGLDVFVEAWAAVSARHPAAEAIVISDADRPPVPGIRFMGTVDAEEKARLLASSSVLIAPNLGGESFGLVVAEGMAAGCAVVASGLAAFAAVLGDTGVLCKPGDAAAFADAISELLGDPGRARGLGERARERAMAFDIGTVGPRYEEAYGDAVAADRSEPRR